MHMCIHYVYRIGRERHQPDEPLEAGPISLRSYASQGIGTTTTTTTTNNNNNNDNNDNNKSTQVRA